MVNHVRTLLLNLPQAGGEVYVPGTYVPPLLPQTLRTARTALFGSPTTRAQLAARVDRLLTYAHASTLAPDITAVDTRLTYDPTRPAAATDPATDPTPHAFAAAAADDSLEAVFTPTASDAEARWYAVWQSNETAPTRAVALALALAARTAELAGN